MTDSAAADGTARGRGRRAGVRDAYTALRQLIIDMQLAPNSELDELALVRRLGVSRTPLREALAHLAAEGLVVQVPNRGAYVAPVEVSGLRQYFEALDFIQRGIYRLAAERADDATIAAMREAQANFEAAATGSATPALNAANRSFHGAIARASDNAHLRQAYERLLIEGSRIAYLCYSDLAAAALQEHLARTIAEHRDHIAAIAAGEAARAERLAGDHAELFRQRVVASLAAGSSALGGVTPEPGQEL